MTPDESEVICLQAKLKGDLFQTVHNRVTVQFFFV